MAELDKKKLVRLYNLCGKIEKVFNDVYITSNGYIVSVNFDNPYLIFLSDVNNMLNDFYKVCGLFKVIHIKDIRYFRKFFAAHNPTTVGAIDDYYNIVDRKSEIEYVKKLLTAKINIINSIPSWENFVVNEGIDVDELVNTLFTKNQHVEFKPKSDDNSPAVMLTKSLIPLITEKNVGTLYYAVKKENSSLYAIIFNIQLEFFRLNMIHYYIPMK